MTAHDPDTPLTYQGARYRLCNRPGVREEDIANFRVTLIAEAGGHEIPLEASEFQKAPLPGGNMPEPHPKVHIRELFESVIRLGFDDQWIGSIANFVSNQGMLRTSPPEA